MSRRIVVQSQPRQILLETLSQKCPTQRKAGGVAPVVESLPSKSEALQKKKKKKKTNKKPKRTKPEFFCKKKSKPNSTEELHRMSFYTSFSFIHLHPHTIY
jgi:hypothetical protein